MLIAFSFLSPTGRFADVQNDLRTVKPDAGSVYTDLDGNIVDIRDFRGKALVINAWATWTPFSQAEIPLLGNFSNRYENSIIFIAINRMEHPEVIRSFLRTINPEYSPLILVDSTDYFYKTIGGFAMPETLFYSKDGVLKHHFRGVLTEQVLDGYVQSLLNE